MASDTQTRPRPFAAGQAWPPHDTEESVVGTDWHQTTITNLRWGLNEAARVGLRPGQPAPWQALSQIILLGCRRPDGSYYRTLPDVFVYPRSIDPQRSSLTVEVDGPPVLIVEVLSESTYEADLDLVSGKGYSYARAGVREYVALDFEGHFLPQGMQGWRPVDGVYQPQLLEADGRWHSAEAQVAIGLEGMWATVYTREGQRILREGEVEEERARLQAELAQRDAEVARLRRLLHDQKEHE